MRLYFTVVLVYTLYVGVYAAIAYLFGGLVALYALGLTLVGAFVLAFLRLPGLLRGLRRREARGRAGFLYGFSDVGQMLPVVKLGRESERGARLAAHRTGAPFGLRVYFNFYVPDAVAAEAFLHRRYAAQRYNRNAEWFSLTPVMAVELWLLGFRR